MVAENALVVAYLALVALYPTGHTGIIMIHKGRAFASGVKRSQGLLKAA
jgi:hypothetical protein